MPDTLPPGMTVWAIRGVVKEKIMKRIIRICLSMTNLQRKQY
jgi:hypothetical protein